MARNRCSPKRSILKKRSRSRTRSNSRTKSKSNSRSQSRKSYRNRTPTPASSYRFPEPMEYDCMATASRSMPAMSKTEEICDNLAGEAARHLNCMSGMLTKASAATSKYFIKQDSDTTWSYGFRVLVGMLLLLALFFLAKNQQVQR